MVSGKMGFKFRVAVAILICSSASLTFGQEAGELIKNKKAQSKMNQKV
jgi:hypothetical protein